MNLKFAILTAIVSFFALNGFAQNDQDYTQYVNPFIGTDGSGHTFPGPATPMGLVQLSPDTDDHNWKRCSGYHHDDRSIMGFSHLHLSGTGVLDMGDILLMPATGDFYTKPGKRESPDEGYRSRFSKSRENAGAGYYSVYLQDHKILAELTTTRRCGMHKYTFKSNDNPYIILNLDHGLGKRRKWMNNESTVESRVHIHNDTLITGHRISDGWAPLQHVYFAMKFSKPCKSQGIQHKNEIRKGKGIYSYQEDLAGFFKFDLKKNEVVKVKVGISGVSVEGAMNNLNKEIPQWNFKKIKKKNKEKWNKYLSRIKISAPDSTKKIFYTALYHNFIAPSRINDTDGKYRGVDYQVQQAEHDYYSTFSLWDTYRATHPLYTIIAPEKVPGMINTMLDHYQKQGVLPIWSLWGTETFQMIGNHAIPVIADAWLKGIDGFDKEKAYQAIKASSTKNHVNANWTRYEKYGYVPGNTTKQAASKTLEFAYDDWCVAQIAEARNDNDIYNHFKERAGYYKNIFDHQTKFFRSKNTQDEWTIPLQKFDPFKSGYSGDYTEGNAWQYSWYVPHDVQGMIELYGGKDQFVNKLDSLFHLKPEKKGDVHDVSGLIGQYAHGNEPSHHIAYLFNYAKTPWKTQQYVNQITEKMYGTGPDGLAGNEDCGQMSAWYIFSALGFYPVNPAEGIYVIGSPRIPEATINLQNGNSFTVKTKNAGKPYIQNVTLNGEPFNKTYIDHQTIINGGSIEFVMGDKPNKKWGINPGSIPPSMSN